MTIELSKIEKSFGNRLVVSDFSLHIESSELFVLLGSSGSGKSTILRLIAGLLSPDSGSIKLYENEVTSIPPQKRNVGFVFQSYAIFRHMTVRDNVEFGLRVRGIPKLERKRRSQELLELVGLTGLDNRYASELSGGQRQRVALARALAYKPSVLLLDEPFGALDARIRSQLRISLKDVQRKLGITSILVTHDQEEAFELGDRIGIVEKGKLIEVGTADGLYHHPKTEFAATFLGGGNVLVGRAEKGRLRLGNNLIDFPKNAPFHEEGAPVRVLFRPETVRVQKESFSEDNVICLGQGILARKTFSGSHERMVFHVEALQGIRPLSHPTPYGQKFAGIEAALSSTRTPLNVGDKLWLGVPSLHVLEPSGLKILVCVGARDEENQALKAAQKIESASHGPVTAIMVIQRTESLKENREKLENILKDIFRESASRLDFRLRQGEQKQEMIRDVQEHFYDLVVLSRHTFESSDTLLSVIEALVCSLRIPVFVSSDISSSLSNILLYISADRSDSEIVRFGARLARHTKSHATVVHMLENLEHDSDEAMRSAHHLEQARLTLESHGVAADTRQEKGSLSENFSAVLENHNLDVIILGAENITDLVSNTIKKTGAGIIIVPVSDV